MARNGSGTYTVLNTFVAGTTITAGDHNENWTDAGAEITNSVAADGQTTMTGPLKHSSGTAAAPSMTFGADTNTGLYRSAADEIGVALGGTQVFNFSADGLEDSAGAILSTLIGEAKIWCLPTAPTGFIFAYGQPCTTAYPLWRAALVAASNPFGTSGGDPLFPDMRGRVVAGQDDMGGTSANRLTNADDGLNGDTFGATGGGETQTLVTGNLPAYTPSGSIGMGTLSANIACRNFQIPGGGGANQNVTDLSGNPGDNTAEAVNFAGTMAFTGDAQGGTSTAFGIVQPTIILNFIVRAA